MNNKEQVDTVLLTQIKNVLLSFSKYWDGDLLLRNKVVEDIRSYNEEVIEALITNKLIKDTYSITFDSTTIFKVEDFISMLRYKNYWENSYTKYSNEVGLTSDGKYLNYNTDVLLDFPHKDGILEGGMTKEDKNKKEIYYHNILAKEEIDVLLSPKVLTNVRKYEKKDKREVKKLKSDDNLIIKGNNLIALYTLKKRYEGRVKAIYIDPPYNTGFDSFKYNDQFNHSTWLAFMQSRLKIAKEFLKEDGVIMISIDDNQQAELKLLCNEIFGSDNFLANLIWNLKTGTQAGHFTRSHEYILVYAKNKSLLPNFSGGEGFIEHGALKKISQKNPSSEFTFPKGTRFDAENGTELKGIWGVSEQTKLISGRMIAEDSKLTEDVTLEAGWAMKSQMTNWFNKQVTYDSKGQKVIEFYFNNNGTLRYKKERSVINPKTVLSDVGSTKAGTSHLAQMLNDSDFSFPKNEYLIERLISITTSEKDLIMDFFLGSGTTAAVAHKLNRQYIGIEQMDYINEVSIPRLQKVIEGEQGGISKDVEWKDGGSFVYAELHSLNETYLKNIQTAKDEDSLADVLETMNKSAYLNFKVDLNRVTSADKGYKNLTLEEKKNILIKSLDMNQLYLNYSEINDKQHEISEDVKQFNYSFYQKEGDE